MAAKVEPKGEQQLARLELWFACPHCGAPTAAGEESDSVDCSHCRSLLFLARPDAPTVGMAECVLRTDDDLRRVYIDRRLSEKRAELCGQPSRRGGTNSLAWAAGEMAGGAAFGPLGGAIGGYVLSGLLDDGGGISPGEMAREPPFLKEMLDVEKKRLEGIVRLGERRLLHVPYFQVRALVLQSILGRGKGGDKVLTVRARLAEQSTPAYDTTRWNLRDRGMRVGTARMKLLTPQDATAGSVFLPIAPAAAAKRDDLERAARLPPQDLERLHARGELVAMREFVVYRPVWLARLLENNAETWLLIEAGTGIVGGLVTEARELEAFLSERGADPFTRLAPTRVLLAASRCVECGRDVPHEPGPWLRICPHCRTGLALTADGLLRASHEHARPTGAAADEMRRGPTAWIPCWSYRFALRAKTGEMIVTLDELAGALGVPPQLRTVSGDRVHVPAMRLLGLLRGEKAFDDLCQWLHRSRVELQPGPIPGSAAGASVGADLHEGEARELARAALHALLDAPMIARLSAAIVRERLDQPEVLLADARLVMVEVPERLAKR